MANRRASSTGRSVNKNKRNVSPSTKKKGHKNAIQKREYRSRFD